MNQPCLEFREGLLRDNPQSGQTARDVSVSLERLGDFLAGRGQAGDAEKALGHYERSLEVSEGLLRDNPQSGQAARDVIVSCYKLGLFELQLGKQDCALTFLKRCFTLLESFIREDRPVDPPMRALHEKLKPLFTEPK